MNVYACGCTLMHIERAGAVEWLRAKDAGSAKVVVLDPPYRGPTDAPPRGRDDGAGGQVFGLFGLLHNVFDATYRVLEEGGVAIVFCDFKRTADVIGIAGMAGLRLNTCIAWVQNRVGTGGMFRSAWNPILVLSKGSPKTVDQSAVPNVIHCEPVPPRRRTHVYEKPAAVFTHILKRVVVDGDVVLDPFAGSGASCALGSAGCAVAGV